MAGKYILILEGEFDTIFKAEKGWVKDYSGNAEEIVYKKSLKSKPDVMVKVYSSIHKNSGLSRKVGQDAIRVCAINTRTNRGVRASRRINRVPGWEERVVNRVTEMWEDLKQ